MKRPIAAVVMAVAMLVERPGSAATTATWEMNGFADFIRGKLTNIGIASDGRLRLGFDLRTVFSAEQPQLWALTQDSKGSLFLGSGHRGRLYQVDAQGKGSPIWTADEPEIFALATGKNAVFAATAPDGKIFRIENGKATEYFTPQAKYIWSLAVAADGALYAGTGDPGRVYRITAAGKGEIYYESGQTHITSLALDPAGKLLAGSEPNGILYRVDGPNKAFVLYDANLPEIRAILPGPDGSLYVAALGGSLSRRGGAPGAISGLTGGNVVVAPPQSITVTDAQAGPGLPKQDPKPVVTSGVVSAVAAGSTPQAYEVAGIEKSAIFRVNPDNTVETLFSSKDENIYDLALSENKLLFSTDGQGRIYSLGDDRKPSLLVQSNEGETTRLLATNEGVLAVSGGAGKLLRMSGSSAPRGEYESPVHDAGTVARWGRLSWRAEFPAGITFRTRSGNSAKPDNTWSDWSAPLADRESALIKSPNARYIQWKAEFAAANGQQPALSSVTAAYLPQNTAPVVRSVTVNSVSARAAGAGAVAATPQTAAGSAFSVTVTDTGETSAAAGAPTQAVGSSSGANVQVTWQADDPEGDRLTYVVYFRGEEEREWKLLRANFFENSLTIDGDILADGRYYFRVVAHDRPSNPLEYARQSDGISAPVLIDNTPPLVKLGTPKRDGAKLDLELDAVDATSALKRCEYSIDASAWVPVEAADGVTDSAAEKFSLRLDTLRPGEHVVVVRVYDQAGNAGLAKVVVR